MWCSCTEGKMDFVRNLPNFKDYEINIVALVVRWDEIEARGINRAEAIGRHRSRNPVEWDQSLTDISSLCHESRSKQCIVFENSDFDHPRVIYSRINRLEDLAASIGKAKAEAEK